MVMSRRDADDSKKKSEPRNKELLANPLFTSFPANGEELPLPDPARNTQNKCIDNVYVTLNRKQ